MKPSPITPADFATLRTLLALTQFRMGVVLRISQAAVAKFERSELALPRKAHGPLSLLRQGYPATPENGNRLATARTRLALTPETLATALNLTPADYSAMEEGDLAIPWSVFMPLRTLEWERGHPPTFDPAEDAARYLAKSILPVGATDLSLFGRLDDRPTRFTSQEEREAREIAEYEAEKADAAKRAAEQAVANARRMEEREAHYAFIRSLPDYDRDAMTLAEAHELEAIISRGEVPDPTRFPVVGGPPIVRPTAPPAPVDPDLMLDDDLDDDPDDDDLDLDDL